MFRKIVKNDTTMCILIKNPDFFYVKVLYFVIKFKVIRSRIEKLFVSVTCRKFAPTLFATKFTLARRLTQIGMIYFGFAVAIGFV